PGERIFANCHFAALNQESIESMVGEEGAKPPFRPIIPGGDRAGAGSERRGKHGPENYGVEIAGVVGEINSKVGRWSGSKPASLGAANYPDKGCDDRR